MTIQRQTGRARVERLRNDAIVEGKAVVRVATFVHFETRTGFIANVKAFSVALGRDEDVVLHTMIDDAGKRWF